MSKLIADSICFDICGHETTIESKFKRDGRRVTAREELMNFYDMSGKTHQIVSHSYSSNKTFMAQCE